MSVAAREVEDGDWIGFAKGLKKTHKYEGRLGQLDGSDLWLLMVVRDL